MHVGSQGDISYWLDQGWREIDRGSPEGDAAHWVLLHDGRRCIQEYGSAFWHKGASVLIHPGNLEYCLPWKRRTLWAIRPDFTNALASEWPEGVLKCGFISAKYY